MNSLYRYKSDLIQINVKCQMRGVPSNLDLKNLRDAVWGIAGRNSSITRYTKFYPLIRSSPRIIIYQLIRKEKKNLHILHIEIIFLHLTA